MAKTHLKSAKLMPGPRSRSRRSGSRPVEAVVRSSIVVDFKRMALAADIDPLKLVQRVGLARSSLDESDMPLPARKVIDLLEVAALSSGIEDFGLKLGIMRGLPDLGPAVLMLREKETVRGALQTLTSMLYLHTSATYVRLTEIDAPLLSVDLLVGDPRHCRQAIDLNVSGLAHIARWLLGDDWAPALVCFSHARPRRTSAYEKFFRAPVEFSHDFNGLVLTRKDLDRKLPAPSPALRRQVERLVRTIELAPSEAYLHQVKQVVAMALPRGEARAEIIADYLGTYRQALNRRLKQGGLNYSAVVETVRRNLATQYLDGGERSLSEIAGLVGFASQSAFTRWFGASFGCSPREWQA